MMMVRIVTATLSVALSPSLTAAQQNAPGIAPQEYTGCVSRQKDAPDTYIFSGAGLCTQLAGKFKGSKIEKRKVILKGLLSQATDALPATLEVKEVGTVGESCDETCELAPPGQRSLHKKSHVGKDAGPAGEQQPQQPPP